VQFAYFHDRRDAFPAVVESTWAEVADGLSRVRAAECTLSTCRHSECEHKDGPGWSPVGYPVGAGRGALAVERVWALVLDFDHLQSADAVDRALARLAGYQLVVHSSHSDRPGDRCLRAVVGLSAPVPGGDWPRFWSAALAHLGLAEPADPKCRDASRLYFLPSRPRDACHPAADGTGFHYESREGRLLDVGEILAAAPPVVWESRAPAEIPEFRGAPSPEVLADAAQALGAAWPDRDRHSAQLALSGALARAGWPAELVAHFCAAVAEVQEPGNEKLAKRLKAAQSSIEKIQRGENVAGWPALERLLRPVDVSSSGEPGAGGPGAPAQVMPAALVAAVRSLLGMGSVERDDAFSAAMGAVAQVPVWDMPAPAAAPGAVATGTYAGPREAVLLHEVAGSERPAVRSYATHYPELDVLLGGGISTRQLIVVCAPPGDGKTAWAIDLALRLGIPVLYASTELESDEVAARAAANLRELLWRDAVRGKIDKSILVGALRDQAGRFRAIGPESLPRDAEAALRLIWDAAVAMTVEHGVAPLVVVDYMQDLARGGDERGLRQRVGDIATTLRVMSQKLDLPLIAISSVSRGYYGASKQESLRESTDPRVYLAAMKESGDVDYAAATAIFLDVGNAAEGQDARPARIALAKCRHGEVGFVGARFRGATGRWSADAAALGELAGKERMQVADERALEDARALVEPIHAGVRRDGQMGPPTCNEVIAVVGASLGFGKTRTQVALNRALADGLVVAVPHRRLEGTKRKERVCVFPADRVPGRDEAAEAVVDKNSVAGKFLR
jgi:hypothetical protein